jgi:hypothetical protein
VLRQAPPLPAILPRMTPNKINYPDIVAEVYYLSPQQGGREVLIRNGEVSKFWFDKIEVDVRQEFIDKEICLPGETVKVLLKFAACDEFIPFSIGMKFEIKESETVIGKGFVTIINQDIISRLIRSKLYNWIDKVIWEDWDPIGVNEFPEARDEYYSYLPEILRLIEANGGATEIATYLNSIAVGHMGLNGNYGHCLEVAEKILTFSRR